MVRLGATAQTEEQPVPAGGVDTAMAENSSSPLLIGYMQDDGITAVQQRPCTA
jgi:hypothetical protein